MRKSIRMDKESESYYKKSNPIVRALALLLGPGLWLSSCQEIFEVRLDEATVIVLLPQDSLATPVATQTFWWEDVYGATQYHIQIVSPGFDSIYTLISDEIIDTSKYTYTLNPGTYQWRVKALNSATASPWTTQTLIIDSTLDLTTQTLVLISPAQNDTSGTLNYNFSWQQLYNADSYRYEVWQPNLNGQLIASGTVATPSFTATLSEEGAFTWRVRAENALGNTPYSSRNGFIDTTAPQLSTPLAPANNAALTGTVSFSWLRATDSGSSVKDSVLVASDSLFIQVLNTYVSRNTTVTDSLISGTYYWRLYTKDKAGNTSGPTTRRTFTVQ